MKDNLMTAVLMKDLAGRSRISSCRQYFMTAHIASRSGSGRSPGTLFDGIYLSAAADLEDPRY